MIQEYINDLSGRLKPRTVKNYATTLTGFFNANVAYDWTPENLAGIGRDLEVEVAHGAGGGQAINPPERRSETGSDTGKASLLDAEFRSLVEACDPWTADAVQLMASSRTG